MPRPRGPAAAAGPGAGALGGRVLCLRSGRDDRGGPPAAGALGGRPPRAAIQDGAGGVGDTARPRRGPLGPPAARPPAARGAGRPGGSRRPWPAGPGPAGHRRGDAGAPGAAGPRHAGDASRGSGAPGGSSLRSRVAGGRPCSRADRRSGPGTRRAPAAGGGRAVPGGAAARGHRERQDGGLPAAGPRRLRRRPARPGAGARDRVDARRGVHLPPRPRRAGHGAAQRAVGR